MGLSAPQKQARAGDKAVQATKPGLGLPITALHEQPGMVSTDGWCLCVSLSSFSPLPLCVLILFIEGVSKGQGDGTGGGWGQYRQPPAPVRLSSTLSPKHCQALEHSLSLGPHIRVPAQRVQYLWDRSLGLLSTGTQV